MKFLRKKGYYTGIVYEWNLPSGHTCPFADECLVKVDRGTGKFNDKSQLYKCYSAVQERFPAVRNHRWKNFDFVLGGGVPELPKKADSIRIHMSGDFYNQKYFDMWLGICKNNHKKEFWAYTKSLKYWVKRIDDIPNNLILTASRGGRNDYLIDKYNLKNVTIIKNEADAVNGPIDTNDDWARTPKINFYLLDNFKK